jgi:BolA protein
MATIIADQIHQRLKDALAPTYIEVRNDSHLHKDHVGHPGGAETHFTVTVISDQFKGESRLARHQMVYDLLKNEMANGVHALSLRLSPPDEK